MARTCSVGEGVSLGPVIKQMGDTPGPPTSHLHVPSPFYFPIGYYILSWAQQRPPPKLYPRPVYGIFLEKMSGGGGG